MGVIGMNLNDGDEVVGMQLDHQGIPSLLFRKTVWARGLIWKNFPFRKGAVKALNVIRLPEKDRLCSGRKGSE